MSVIPVLSNAKIFVSDNSRAGLVEQSTWLPQSFYHLCATYLYRTSSVVSIEEDFQATKAIPS